jgi:hypothetical protein
MDHMGCPGPIQLLTGYTCLTTTAGRLVARAVRPAGQVQAVR